MLTTLDRYIGRSILFTTALVLLTLVALAAVFGLIAELDDVGRGNYTLSRALYYTVLTLPGKAWLLFSPAVLLGSLLGLGALANNSEITVMRAAGISTARIVRAVLITGIGFMVVITLLGEYVVPKTEQFAEKLRLTALEKRVSVGSRSGLWVKSGELFINIGTVMPDFTLIDLVLYEFDERELSESVKVAKAVPLSDIEARNAIIDGVLGNTATEGRNRQRFSSGWRLFDLEYTVFNPSGAESYTVAEELRGELVSPDVLQGISVSPENLSIRNLMDQVAYLNANNLDSKRVELALWVKVSSPLATMVMLMLSLPFVFSSQRSGGAGQKIFVGIMLGIGYVLVNKLLTQLGLANGLPPALSAFLPLVLFLLIAILGLQRVS